jgi:hypothetical protein
VGYQWLTKRTKALHPPFNLARQVNVTIRLRGSYEVDRFWTRKTVRLPRDAHFRTESTSSERVSPIDLDNKLGLNALWQPSCLLHKRRCAHWLGYRRLSTSLECLDDDFAS